jgi:type IV secretion system protein TrbD
MQEPRRVPIRRSIIRPHMVMGGERELVLGAALVGAIIFVSGSNALTAVLGVLFWLASIAALQRMGKRDPSMSRVYLRHLNYRGYYPASLSLHSQVRMISARGFNN